jgi:hypothetical protein
MYYQWKTDGKKSQATEDQEPLVLDTTQKNALRMIYQAYDAEYLTLYEALEEVQVVLDGRF